MQGKVCLNIFHIQTRKSAVKTRDMLTRQENKVAVMGTTFFQFNHVDKNLVICIIGVSSSVPDLHGQTWVTFQIKQMARVVFLQFLLAPTLRSCAGMSSTLILAELVWRLDWRGQIRGTAYYNSRKLKWMESFEVLWEVRNCWSKRMSWFYCLSVISWKNYKHYKATIVQT